jgi:hypothetical protein
LDSAVDARGLAIMDMTSPVVRAFAARYGCTLTDRIGVGNDGAVFRTDRFTAVKFAYDRIQFLRELEVYQVLTELCVERVLGHEVPSLRGSDAELRAIEMTVVSPPFLLDFAAARRSEEVPDFEDYVWEEHHERMKDKFGHHWQDVLQVADAFERLTGYALLDLHPGNIRFGDEATASSKSDVPF